VVAYPSLNHIDVGALIAAAGGDPWNVYASLESGDAGQISELARAFYAAGACTDETWNEFNAATERFHESWNRENGEHPIDDAAEVQRAKTQLFVQAEQLPQIGIDLQNIAANLAEAQRMSSFNIDSLNDHLVQLDGLIGAALAADMNISGLEETAIAKTTASLGAIEIFRDSYAAKLQEALTDLRHKHGYDPAAIDDVDGDGVPGDEQRGQSATEHYDTNQRAKDEELVNAPGEMTQDKADAAARLRDFGTVNDPAAAPEARRLAGERLDDFRMANFMGPLPKDPVLGGDARTRAQQRLDMQRQLGSGRIHLGDGLFHDVGPMTPDQATQTLDDGEQFARVTATRQAFFALTRDGMSEEGALKTLSNLASNAGPVLSGAQAYGWAIPDNRHNAPTDLLSASDAKTLQKLASRAGTVGNLFQLGVAGAEWFQGGENRNEEAGAAVGGVFGGVGAAWATAALAGSVTGPWTTAAIVATAVYFASKGGNAVGSDIGRRIDSAG